MNIHIRALLALLTVLLVGGSGQAQAMNLLVAAGNPQVRLELAADGSLKLVPEAMDQTIKVTSIEPAAGAHGTETEK